MPDPSRVEFSPNNRIVKLCLQGMQLEDNGKPDDAARVFFQAWSEATYDFEKFISAHFSARAQAKPSDRLHWLETALQFALKINDDTVKSALPALYSNIARCHEELGAWEQARKHHESAASLRCQPSDRDFGAL